jgi:hypothetical protein
MMLTQIVLGLGKHPTGAAGRVEELAHGAGRGEQLVILDEEDAYHETDDLARREVIARGLIGQFVEPADEVLEDEPHLRIKHPVGVQIHVAELRDDEIEDVGLAHLLDLAPKLEVLEDAADIGRDTINVADKMLGDVVGVALELSKSSGE